MGDNDMIRDKVAGFFESLRQSDSAGVARLLFLGGPNEPDPVQEVVPEWAWSPAGIHRPRGLYRADVAVLSAGVPLLVVEVDVSTSGKAAVGAMLMAELAFRDAVRRRRLWSPLYWFQVVTTPEKKDEYAERLQVVYDQVFGRAEYRSDAPEFVENTHCTLCLGQGPLVAAEACDLAAWRRVKPSTVGRTPEKF